MKRTKEKKESSKIIDNSSENKGYENLLFLFIIIFSIISGLIMYTVFKVDSFVLFKEFIIVILFLGVVEVIIQNSFYSYFEEKRCVGSLCIGYAISLFSIIIYPVLPIYMFWIAGSIYIAKRVNSYIGVVFHLIVTFLLCSIHGLSIEQFIYYFLTGGIICLLVEHAGTISTLLYVLVTAASAQIILSFLLNNFKFAAVITEDTFFSLLSSLLLILLSYFIKKINLLTSINSDIFHTIMQKEEESVNKEEITAAATKPEELQEEKEEKNTPNKTKDEKLLEILSVDAPLLKRLNEEKAYIYRHCLLIGLLSERASEKVLANTFVAKAGGLYHEVGKLVQGNYVENGIALAREYELPEEVIDIIEQHNGKYKEPASKEAAIVMLTDRIISTIKYFEKKEESKNISNEQIINNIFKTSLEKGILDNSGLTITQYNVLKEFYCMNLPKGGKN